MLLPAPRLGLIATVCSLILTGCAFDPIKDPQPWSPVVITKHSWTQGPTCIAFSGGGIRSAAFSIGAMQGLHDAGLLQTANYMTATSGGSYAASWLYTAHRDRGISLAEALDSQSKEQARLSNQAKYFVTKTGSGILGILGAITGSVEHSYNPTQCENGSKDLLSQSASLGYQLDISGMFHKKDSISFLNSISQNPESPLPELIVGVSITPGHKPSCEGPIADKLLPAEISRQGLRSGTRTYQENLSTWKFSQVIGSASSAIDVTKDDSAKFNVCRFWEQFRPLTGGAACTPHIEDSAVTYITDGGFTDNLVLLPAIARECKVIVSFDATHDPSLIFDDLEERRKDLTNLGIQVDQIKAEIRGDQDPGVFAADKAVQSTVVKRSPSGALFAYVKLSIPKGAEDLPPLTSQTLEYSSLKYPTLDGCLDKDLKRRCRFPQETTVRQTMHPSEFMAYRDLARWIVREKLVPALSQSGAISPVAPATTGTQ